jgi:hypothetical protein
MLLEPEDPRRGVVGLRCSFGLRRPAPPEELLAGFLQSDGPVAIVVGPQDVRRLA